MMLRGSISLHLVCRIQVPNTQSGIPRVLSLSSALLFTFFSMKGGAGAGVLAQATSAPCRDRTAAFASRRIGVWRFAPAIFTYTRQSWSTHNIFFKLYK